MTPPRDRRLNTERWHVSVIGVIICIYVPFELLDAAFAQ